MYKGKGIELPVTSLIVLGLKTSVATFGIVPYGHTILGRVEIADPFDACKDVKFINTKEESEIPFILLAKRGNCTFATKAFNAGQLGASAIIVLDDRPEDPSYVVPYAEPSVGLLIHIPTILVNEAEFQDITTAVKSHKSDVATNEHDIMLSVNFPVVKREKASVSFLLDISDRANLETMAQVKEYLSDLVQNDSVEFSNYYDLIATKGKIQDTKKPLNCVNLGDQLFCSKSPGK